jgi:hypothetical protein
MYLFAVVGESKEDTHDGILDRKKNRWSHKGLLYMHIYSG